MDKKEICFHVGTHNCAESNLFLRKFYEVMSHSMKVAWNFQSFREGKSIYVGTASFGEMWIEYQERGKIDKVRIRPEAEEYYAIVESALKEARDTCLNSFINYKVVLSVSSEEIRIRPQACGNISVSYDEERCRNLLTFNVKAFGDFDFRYVINQKANYIRHLLCIYTNAIFQVAIVGKSVEDYECADTGWQEYDYNWVDTSDIFVSETELLLSPDFYRILNFVLKDIQYERSLRLILNSAQQLFIANLMKRDAFSSGEYNIPGYVDLINTTLVSSLEPVANLDADEPETCKECGQLKYSIRKKVKDLCQKYLPDHLVKMISNDLYSDRSKFLHEGNPRTNEFYCGRCVPLLDPTSGRDIMQPACSIDLNMFEYVSYVIRKVIGEQQIDDCERKVK